MILGHFNVHFASTTNFIYSFNDNKRPLQSKLLIEPLVCIFMVEETFISTEIWKNQEALLTFLRKQDARQGSSECRPELNQIAPLIIAATIVKQN